MIDSMRDRIAAVIDREVDGLWEPLAVADAVIALLTDQIRGCADPWHWETGEPFRCPSCGYWVGEGYVEPAHH